MTIFLSVVQPTFASSSFWYIKIKSYICRGNPFNSSINKKKSKPVPTEADEGSSVEFISQTWAAEVGETLHHHQHPLSWLVVTTDLEPPWWFGEHQSVLSRYIHWCRHLQYLVTSWSIIWSLKKCQVFLGDADMSLHISVSSKHSNDHSLYKNKVP